MEQCDKVFGLFKELLDLHIETKTSDPVFHKESLFFYENAFDVYHDTLEALQDSKQIDSINPEIAKKRATEILSEIKSILESMINGNKDIAVDNVLRGLYEKINFQYGTACSFSPATKVKEDEPTEEPEEESTEEPEEETEEDTEETEEPTEEATDEEVKEEEEDNMDIMGDDMEKNKSGYTYSSKEKLNKEEELKKKRRGSTEYSVISIF